MSSGSESDDSCKETCMDISTSPSSSDFYEPIKKLASVQLFPPRNPEKPFTPFSISDILAPRDNKPYITNNNNNNNSSSTNNNNVHFVRPWDTSSTSSSNGHIAEDEEEDEDIEIDIVDNDKAILDRVKPSPLDALFQMTSKTFEGLDAHGNLREESSRRDHLSVFSKQPASKKRRKSRTAFTNQQIYELEKRFLYQKYLTPADRDEIAQTLGLSNAQVITWFQNRRAKLKRDLEELKADVTATAKVHPVHKVLMEQVEDMNAKRNEILKKKEEAAKRLALNITKDDFKE
ncbi:transcription factor LBX1 [Lingula anatina]|uniref:Transcription factor LBX1 n=1 Tax=Lingula anatina TaxID=7574 RepID=A0A1S3GYF3_LINAN|nr:transcription factor LBX1 [Lingula anatina]|eukprot:XP_013378788.1 transcription factor LBX1 [Lingula anatina]